MRNMRSIRNSGQAVSPSLFHKQLVGLAQEGSKKMESFRNAWNSEEMQQARAKASADPSPQGDDVWRVDYRKLAKQTGEKSTKEDTSMGVEEESKEDVDKVIEDFKSRHPSIRLDAAGEETIWPVTIRVAGMTFQVLQQAENTPVSYAVGAREGKEVSSMQKQVFKCLNSRNGRSSLAFLMDMLASYTDLQKRPCDICKKLVDDRLNFPVLRMKTKENDTDQWKAYHPSCS